VTVPADDLYDIVVIGGGINGVGVARDAAGRGFSVCLCEQSDLASGTSSASSKLIHGGLRYLEHYEFALVRDALREREVLLQMAPHIVSPMRFVLPHSKSLRPRWLIRLGLFLYDLIGRRKILPGTRSVDFRSDPAGAALKPEFTQGFEYSDCWVDDARLVVLNARDAAIRGAEICVRTKVETMTRQNDCWALTTKDVTTEKSKTLKARIVVNAAGPWVDQVLNSTTARENKAKNVRLVRGSHIVVRKLFEHDRAYIFQNADDRIIFAIPYENDFTLIGTTDVDHSGDMDSVAISAAETDYICASASEYFEQPVRAADVVWSFSGVRPLYDDGSTKAQEATRDYVIRAETAGNTGLISIFGGKITTYRRLSEDILKHVESLLGARGNSWTALSHLPGGDFERGDRAALISETAARYPFLASETVSRLVRLYGTSAHDILENSKSEAELGQHFGGGLYAAEVDHLVEHEWAKTTEDILARRTKLKLVGSRIELQRLETYLEGHEHLCHNADPDVGVPARPLRQTERVT